MSSAKIVASETLSPTGLSKIAFISKLGGIVPEGQTSRSALFEAIARRQPGLEIDVIGIKANEGEALNSEHIKKFVRVGEVDDYIKAAEYINAAQYSVASLHHEFDSFGGIAGKLIMSLLSRLRIPVVTTYDNIPQQPSHSERRVIEQITMESVRVVVRSENERHIMLTQYRVPPERLRIVSDPVLKGYPDEKVLFGLTKRIVILTTGLLSRNKGIEVIIEAMPSILKTFPEAIYIVLGATHPNAARVEGESYRQELKDRITALALEDHVKFIEESVDHSNLLRYISMCDVYVTPFHAKGQISSGTLEHGVRLGKSVVSTPYAQAVELLGDGRGILIPFGNSEMAAFEITMLLTDQRKQSSQILPDHGMHETALDRMAAGYLNTFKDAQLSYHKRMAR